MSLDLGYLRAVPERAVQDHEALRRGRRRGRGGGRERRHRDRRTAGHDGGGDRHAPPGAAQRVDQRGAQALGVDVRGVQGLGAYAGGV